MKKFNNEKSAYYGYFLTSIRVDLYNKIFLKEILDGKLNHKYNSSNILENNLKNKLFQTKQENIFEQYFLFRKFFYEQKFGKYPYSLELTIDLLYEYRNFLLDDEARQKSNKFLNIFKKNDDEKERDIQIIILLLLSEYLLEEFSNQFIGIFKDEIIEYQSSFFENNKFTIKYRKLMKRYFGTSDYTLKNIFLERNVMDSKISYAKKYQLLLILYEELPLINQKQKQYLNNIILRITNESLKENLGLLQIESEFVKYLINLEQLLILYILSKKYQKIFLFELEKYYINKKNQKRIKIDEIITIKTLDIFELTYNNLEKQLNLKKNKSLFQEKMKTLKKFKENNSSNLLLKIILILNLDQRNKYNFFQNNIHDLLTFENIISLEIINYKIVDNDLNTSIRKYLKDEYKVQYNYKEQIFSLVNQIKFTMNDNEYSQLRYVDEEYNMKLQKYFKKNKKKLVTNYLNTIFLLLELNVHSLNKNDKYKELYSYRNEIMHFKQTYTTRGDQNKQEKILQQINQLIKLNKSILEVKFSDNNEIFNILEIKCSRLIFSEKLQNKIY